MNDIGGKNMALINCPICGEQISDKATKCIHCGMVLKEEPKQEKICAECGAIIGENDNICPHCGCPTEDKKEEEQPQKVEVTNVKFSLSKKKRNILIITIAILVLGCIGSVFAKQQYDKIQAEKASTKYKANLKTAVYTMLEGAAKAETASGLIHDVWSNAIYEKSDSKTDKYTKENGYFVDDFNTALYKLMFDPGFSDDIEKIKNNQEQVQRMMKDLKNPPPEHKDAYDALKKFYDSYIELVGCAVNPSGNLSSYTSTYNEAANNTMNNYKAMSLYIED